MRVIFAGGGTAGHINPALAIAGYICEREPDSEVLFFGTERGLEKDLVPKKGYNIKFIDVAGFKRKLTLENISVAKKAFVSTIKCRKIIKEFKPDIVIGTGGYVSGPVLKAAADLKIPTLIHEQNVFVGKCNKMLSRYVDTVCISFEKSKESFPKAKNIVLTGNPIRGELFEVSREKSREINNCPDDIPFVLAFGGSLGAEKLNNAVSKFIMRTGNIGRYKMIFATGENQYKFVQRMLHGYTHKNVEIVPYIHNMEEIMPGADLVIGRAGAITISELSALGIASVLIPSPNVTDNHQEYNARLLEENGASIVILENELGDFPVRIKDLLTDDEKLSIMAENSKKMGIKDATEKIYSEVKKLVKD